jgi:hypothetical protein
MAFLFAMGYCVYILYAAKVDKYYVDRTEDLDNNPVESRKFTAKGIPWLLKAGIDLY